MRPDHEHTRWLFEGVDAWNERRQKRFFEPDFSDTGALLLEFRQTARPNADGKWKLSLCGADFEGAKLGGVWLNPLPDLDVEPVDLRHVSFVRADLKRSHLRQADLRGADLGFANLCEADLRQADLRGATAMLAELRGVDLREADLRRARFASADLGNADLRQADLRGANLVEANLQGANLSGASVDGETALVYARLVGADLSDLDLGRCLLFDHPTTTEAGPPHPPWRRRIRSVAGMVNLCADLGEGGNAERQVYFRGESDYRWPLYPSVMRPSCDGKTYPFRAVEGAMLLEAMSQRATDFRGATSALDQWVLAQHHGLKTRLLDVTRNPLVALFCACGGLDMNSDTAAKAGRIHVFSVPRDLIKPFTSDTVSIMANFAKLRRTEQDALLGRRLRRTRHVDADAGDAHKTALRKLYHLIRQERATFEEAIEPRDLFRVWVVEPQQSFERIRAQSGAFLLSAFHERFEQREIRKWNAATPTYEHWTLSVPARVKRHVLGELASVNITREALFPSLDEAARAITRRHADGG